MLSLRDLSDHKEEIRKPIEDIGRQAGLRNLFSDIVEAIENQNAFLFMEGSTFTVLKPFVSDGTRKLLVWVSFGLENGTLKKHLPQIKQFAKDIDAVSLEFWTALPSMERIAPRLGWKKTFTVYEMGIDT